MIARIGRMSVVLAMLVAASPCLAADPGLQPGKGGVGAQTGLSTFRFDRALGSDWFGDYSSDALTRFAFSGQFRYVVNPWLRWQVSPGFTWAAYKHDVPAPFPDLNFPGETVKDHYLTLLLPVSAQAQWYFMSGKNEGGGPKWVYHVGAGPGIYRVWVENHRKVLKDPVSLKLHRKLHFGGSAQLGVERFLTALPSTSIEASLGAHLALAQHDDYVSGIDSNLMAVEFKIGTTYYFAFGEKKKTAAEDALPHERE